MDSLGMAGASASLISLLRTLDYDRYDVALFLFAQRGAYLDRVPREVKLLPTLPAYAMATEPLGAALWTGVSHGWIGLVLKRLLAVLLGRKWPQFAKITMAKQGPSLPESYDMAIAYCCSYAWQFVVDKVNAQKRVVWLDAEFHRVERLWDAYIKAEAIDCVACVSCANARALKERRPEFAKKICVVHNIVDRNQVRALAAVDEGAFDQTLNLVTVGRISEEKGHDLIVPMALELMRRGVDFCWHLVGPGLEKWKLYLERQGHPDLQGRVKCLGVKTNPYPYFMKASLVVQPSRSEGWGMAVTEAIACGAPVLVSDIPSFREQIVDGENGWIVPLTVEAFVDRIIEFAAGKLALARQGEWQMDYSRPNDFEKMCIQLMEQRQ